MPNLGAIFLTCNVVFTVSIGMIEIRNDAAAREAAAVFRTTGRSRVLDIESISVIIPAFAAVSPNRESGPWRRAG